MTAQLTEVTTGFRGTLQPHQAEGVDWLLGRPNALLADDVGLGKTVQACALIAELDAHNELPRLPTVGGLLSPARVVWVTDSMLIEQTRQELARFLPGLTVETINDKGFGAMKRGGPAGPDLAIINYERLAARSVAGWRDNLRPALVVLDEAAAIRGAGTRFDSIQEVTGRSVRVLSMTATPLQNDPLELFNILRATHTPNLWTLKDYEKFLTWRVANRIRTKWGVREQSVPDGWTPEGEKAVRAYLSGVMLQRSQGQVGGLRLPVQVGESRKYVQLSPAQQTAYDNIKGDGLSAFQRKEAISRAAGATSALVDALMVELAARAEQQAVVYCEYLEILDLVEARLESEDVSFVRIEGDSKPAVRVKRLETFRKAEARVLLGSRVLERGLNLQHCRLMISLDSSWNPAREQQREGRIKRIGSPHETFEHLTLLPDTPLTRNKINTLSRKAATAEAIR